MRIPVNVQRGVELLDRITPDWAEKVDPERLNLGSTCNCVLGQIEGKENPKTPRDDRYTRRLNRIDGDAKKDPGKFGFTTYGNQYFSSLTEGWKNVIRARREDS